MNLKILTITGAVGSGLAALFGGWDTSLQTLLLFMAIDWITGGVLLPEVLKKALSVLEQKGKEKYNW